jgi:inhibitor of growth protein 4
MTRSLKIIHDLDVKVQEILVEIDALKSEYLNEFKQMDTETRSNRMKTINKKYERVKQLSDEKVQIATHTYAFVR